MINVENLQYAYPGSSIQAVKGISFTIHKGEIYGFLGPSGAGKSTTQKILIGLLKDYSGNIVIKGRDLKSWDKSYYEHIGVGFELPNHYPKLTALENLQFFAGFYSKKVKDLMFLLDKVGLADSAGKRVEDFSKGMKMRLNFVRAIMHDPSILFFDEPTSGLDPVNAKKIKDMIQELKEEGKTIMVTTHNMQVADELCDHVAFIIDGEIKLTGAPSALKQKEGKRIVNVEYVEGGLPAIREFALDQLGYNDEFISLLQSHSINSIHSQEASLEEIFIKSTGRRLE